jgi:subtilisin family serine protease
MKLEKRRFCVLIGTALCAALVFAGAALFGDMPGEPQEPSDSLYPCPPPFDGYFVVLPSPPVLRRGFCVVEHSVRGGTTPGQERLAMELKRDLVQGRVNAKIKWEAKTNGPADEIFVGTKVNGTLSESQQARVDAIAASLEAGGEKAKIKIEVEVAPVEEVLAARAEIGAEQSSVLAEIEALGKARFGAAFELPAPRRRYDSLINAVLLDLPHELVGPAKAHSASPPIVGTGVRVAVIDTGVDYTHPAFQVSNPPDPILDNIWTNPGELDEKGRITFGDVTPSSKAPDGCPGRCNVDDDGDDFKDLNDPQVKTADYNNDGVTIEDGDASPTELALAAADDDEDGFADNFHGADFGDNDGDPLDDKDWELGKYHGTYIASIIAGEGCLTGMAPEAQIVAVKIFKSVGSNPPDLPTMADIVDALEWVVNEVQPGAPEPRAEIANISLGTGCGGHPHDVASKAVDSAVLNGVVVVAPSGSGNNLQIISPGTAANAITVTPYTIQQPWNLPDDFWAGGAEGYTRYADPAVPPEDRALFKPDLLRKTGPCSSRTS